MHCYFVLAGNAEIPIIYHVERVRDGKSFATRTVQARQRGKPIFTVTLSFMRKLDSAERVVRHEVKMPDVPGADDNDEDFRRAQGPFESRHMSSLNGDSEHPHTKRTRVWIRSRGKISARGGHEAHLSALAYMSDSFFIGTVARAHNLWRSMPPDPPGKVKMDETSRAHHKDMQYQIKHLNGGQETNTDNKPEIGMMVSLDHTIYFHKPRDFRADEWMMSEMNTPWSGDGRGVVTQHIWSADGQLIATCFQEVSPPYRSDTVLSISDLFPGTGPPQAGPVFETVMYPCE